jgi:hypothetical protein
MPWTVMSEPTVENQVSRAAALLADAIQRVLPKEQLVVGAIIGGYGRGEGGVELNSGVFCPHNNLDVLVVSSGGHSFSISQKEALSEAISKVRDECGIPVDLGYVTENQLEKSRPRVMWYDVRFGHRVLCGDEFFLAGLVRHRASDIPADDVIDLMTNRGALAVIAKELLADEDPSLWAVREAVKGTMKAIVGFGDALLWQRGLYHVSYQEKGRRMRVTHDIDARIQSLYAEAIRFRFQPDYSQYEGRAAEWVGEAIDGLERAHQCFGLGLLGKETSRDDYPEAILRLCLRERGIRGWVSHFRNGAKNYWGVHAANVSWLERASFQRHLLAARLPDALFGNSRAESREFVGDWAEECDVNFPDRLRVELNLRGPH